MVGLIVIVAVVVVLLIAVVVLFNALVRKRNRTENAWAQVDVQLTKRHDLVPNLVETVRGYATHERQTLQAVTDARAAATATQGPAARAAAEDALTSALTRIMAVAENYPQLRASENFHALQDELASIENGIAYSRQYYNDSVLSYDNAISTFPSVIVARLFAFRPREYFRAAADATTPVPVSLP